MFSFKFLLPFLVALSMAGSALAQNGGSFAFETKQQQAYESLTNNETLNELQNSEILLKDEESDWDIIRSIAEDAWGRVKAPAGWDKKEWVVASGVVTVTALLMANDKRIQTWAQANRNELSEEISYYAEMGGGEEGIAGVAATYVIRAILKKPKLKKASVLAFSSLLISGALVQGGKAIFARARPYEARDQWEFHGPGANSFRHQSFPSGHTSTAFAIASVVGEVYDNKLVKILAYAAATLVGISRIHDNQHWASDVFLGAAVGTATGLFISRKHQDKRFKGFSVTPWYGKDRYGGNNFGIQISIPLGGKRR